ncbi:MAG: hypothetical protein FWF50_06375 [Defluviitaleaceae bacterium]|nr:hypothetical protein [Defluviitaleaceae bacterium]
MYKNIRDQSIKLKKDIKGTISIFVILMLIPTIIFTSIMVDWARFNMAHAQLRNAAYLTANSALAFYDGLLLDVYGLLAMSQDRSNMASNATETARLALGLDSSGNRLHQTFNLLGNVSLDVAMGADDRRYSLDNVVYLQMQIIDYMVYRLPMAFFHMDELLDEMREERANSPTEQRPEFAENEVEFMDEYFVPAMEALYDLHTYYGYLLDDIIKYERRLEGLNNLGQSSLGTISSNYSSISTMVEYYGGRLTEYSMAMLGFLAAMADYERARQMYNAAWQAHWANPENFGPPTIPTPIPPTPPNITRPTLDTNSIEQLLNEIYSETFETDIYRYQMRLILKGIVERAEEVDVKGHLIKQELLRIKDILQQRKNEDLSEAFVESVRGDIYEILNGASLMDDNGDPTGERVPPLIITELLGESATAFKNANLPLMTNNDTSYTFTGTLGTYTISEIRANVAVNLGILLTYNFTNLPVFIILSGRVSDKIELVPFNESHKNLLQELRDLDDVAGAGYLREVGMNPENTVRSNRRTFRDLLRLDPADILDKLDYLPNLEGINLPEMREMINEGMADIFVEDLISRIILAEYGVQMFSNLTTNRRLVENNGTVSRVVNETTLSGIPFDTNINLAFGGELEFIFAGRESMRSSGRGFFSRYTAGNLEYTIRWMYAVLLARNILYTFESQLLRNELRKIRAIPKIGFILAEIYRLTLAHQETQLDILTILEGARTPLRKNPRARTSATHDNRTQWRSGPSYIGLRNAWNSERIGITHGSPSLPGVGLYYYQLLRIMIFVFNDSNTITHRIGHLIQANLNHHLGLQHSSWTASAPGATSSSRPTRQTFSLENAYVLTEVNLNARIPHFFINTGGRYREFNISVVRGY